MLGAIIGLSAGNLTGGVAEVLPNHHITKPVFIGEIQEDGQLKVVWRSDDAIAGDAWSDYLPESAGWTADWSRNVNCGKLSELSSDCLDHEPF